MQRPSDRRSKRSGAGAAATQKHTRPKQVAEVVPPARIRERIYSKVSEQASDKRKENQEPVKKTRKESRRIINARRRLGRAAGKKRAPEEHQKAGTLGIAFDK